MGEQVKVMPSVQDAICACDKVRLAQAIARTASLPSPVKRPSFEESVCVAACEMLEGIASMEEVPPSSLIAVRRERFAVVGASALGRRNEIVYLDERGSLGPRRASCDFPSRDWLGSGVWFGEESRLSDRYDALATLCWEMMICGWGSDSADAAAVLRIEESFSSEDAEWSACMARQWDLAEPDLMEQGRIEALQRRCDELNAGLDVRFLADVADLQRYMSIALQDG